MWLNDPTVDIRSATLIEATEMDPSGHLAFTVQMPDRGEIFVQGRCLIGGRGGVTIEVDGNPAVKSWHDIDDDDWHDIVATVCIRRGPGESVALRMVIDGTYRIEPGFPASLRAMPFPEPAL